MKKLKRRHIITYIVEGANSIDITGEDYRPRRNRDNIIISWSNVGRYFSEGFNKVKNENHNNLHEEEELTY